MESQVSSCIHILAEFRISPGNSGWHSHASSPHTHALCTAFFVSLAHFLKPGLTSCHSNNPHCRLLSSSTHKSTLWFSAANSSDPPWPFPLWTLDSLSWFLLSQKGNENYPPKHLLTHFWASFVGWEGYSLSIELLRTLPCYKDEERIRQTPQMWYPWLLCLMGEGYNQPQIIPRAYTLTAFLHSGLCADAPVLTSWLSTDGRLFSPVRGLVPISLSIGMLSGTVTVAGPGPDYQVMELIVIQSIAHKMRSILTIKFGTYKYQISFPHI